MDYMILKADGTAVAHNGKPTLSNLQAGVGGLVEAIDLDEPTPMTMWLNEEGRLMHLPINYQASYLSGFLVVGDAVFTGTADRFGNTRTLSTPAQRYFDKYLVVAKPLVRFTEDDDGLTPAQVKELERIGMDADNAR